MPHRTSRARLFCILPALLLLAGLAACGGPSATKAAATPSPAAPTVTASPSVPTPQPPPYVFPAFWRSNGPIPGDVGGFAFSHVDPRTGYVCASVPSQPGAYPRPQADRLSGPAPLYVTHDGGATWMPVGAGTLHNLASGGVGDSGYFRLRTGDANPGWQPLASSWQISQPYSITLSAGGVRLWALQATAQGANNLVSLDLS